MKLNKDIVPALEDVVENTILSASLFCVSIQICNIDKFMLTSRVIQSFLMQFSIDINSTGIKCYKC